VHQGNGSGERERGRIRGDVPNKGDCGGTGDIERNGQSTHQGSKPEVRNRTCVNRGLWTLVVSRGVVMERMQKVNHLISERNHPGS